MGKGGQTPARQCINCHLIFCEKSLSFHQERASITVQIPHCVGFILKSAYRWILCVAVTLCVYIKPAVIMTALGVEVAHIRVLLQL